MTVLKKPLFNYKLKIKIKTTITTAIKNELKYSSMSEDNPCIPEPDIEVLPLK